MIDLYFQPYGDEQQLNLNWIINEIINLHKQLDPDYETPSFTQVYPYSNLNRLNLDWVLSELKALKELAPEPTPTIDIQAVAEALVALPFDTNTPYQIYDFISRDGEIWRATEAIPSGGVWDETKWFKTKIGTDLAVLERWINSINNSLTAEIQARQDADTTLQTNIDNEALARQLADTALQNTINGLTSANISDDSDAGGANVKASLNLLKGFLNDILPLDNTPTSGSTKGVTSGGVYSSIIERLNNVADLPLISDCNSSQYFIGMCNASTLNTPATEGVTTSTEGICFSLKRNSPTWNVQYFFLNGGSVDRYIFTRHVYDVSNSWSQWESINSIITTHDVPYTAGADLPSGTTVSIKERNGIVTLSIKTNANSLPTATERWYNLATIGSGYRPSTDIGATAFYQEAPASSTIHAQTAIIGSDGLVRIYLRNTYTAVAYLTITATYII